MKPNEGTTDRIIRLVLAAVLFLLAFTLAGGVWVYVVSGLGAVMLLTATVGFYLLYVLQGVNLPSTPVQGSIAPRGRQGICTHPGLLGSSQGGSNDSQRR